MKSFTNVPHGCLQEGDETQFGVIESVSLTAYLIDGVWFPFCRVHGDRKIVVPFFDLIEWSPLG